MMPEAKKDQRREEELRQDDELAYDFATDTSNVERSSTYRGDYDPRQKQRPCSAAYPPPSSWLDWQCQQEELEDTINIMLPAPATNRRQCTGS